jgi:hypothetical protein
VPPNALVTERAICTIAELSAVFPAGRSPTFSFSTVSFTLLPQRAFSRARESSKTFMNCESTVPSAFTSAERMSISIQASYAMELMDVPPPIRPTLNVVLGSDGT